MYGIKVILKSVIKDSQTPPWTEEMILTVNTEKEKEALEKAEG